MTEEAQQGPQAINLRWSGADTVPIYTANQFLVQIDGVGENPDQLILAVGQATPPVVLGTPEEKQAQIEAIDHVNIITLARYSVTPARLAELIDVLQTAQHMFEGQQTTDQKEVPA